FVQLRIAKVKQTTTNGIDSTYQIEEHKNPGLSDFLSRSKCAFNIKQFIKKNNTIGTRMTQILRISTD
ncbi:MAG: hypothetical protein MZV64_14525, partial [Ignavibacteriales bacterium]|nr:hypothetical protein [Ignavibacteriales bacterium]